MRWSGKAHSTECTVRACCGDGGEDDSNDDEDADHFKSIVQNVRWLCQVTGN